ncbi:hypothetical protein FJ364_05010 [Candidatus Dependentiae bacterium]|nr:hypothetical protein [Candidatus Dependentiae bacterium]
MNGKIGRNDPCYCGSGKKYKKCCLENDESTQNVEHVDFQLVQLRKLEGTVFDQHLIPYATQALPEEVLKTAIEDWLPEEDLPESMDRQILFENFFIPWAYFNWIPYDDFGLPELDPDITLAENYLRAHQKTLNSQERRFIDAMVKTYYSFYSILEVTPNKSLFVKDIMLGVTHTIKERQGTHQLKRGDIVFSRILTLDHQSIFVGMAPYIVPTKYHTDLIEFKNWLIEENDGEPLTPELLRNDLDIELLDYFFEVMISAYNQPFPTLMNTDGELFQFSKSFFKLSLSPEETLKQLMPLTLSEDPEEFLVDAKRNATGEIIKIEFPWLKKGNEKHKSWDNTVMGQISIEPRKLTLETNSNERTERGKTLLNKYLGDEITFQNTLIESPEHKIKSAPKGLTANHDQDMNKLLELPEVQEKLKAMAKKHWETWFDEPIPVLDQKTPREAVRTELGKEKLEALLLEYERHDSEKANDFLKADIPYLRKELGLEVEQE